MRDLPDNCWSVSWPGYEYHVVNSGVKARRLLEILFDLIGVDRACLAVTPLRGTDPDKFSILEIDVSAWWQSAQHAAEHVEGFAVTAVKFREHDQAEKFKTHLEQRYIWRKLGGEWK